MSLILKCLVLAGTQSDISLPPIPPFSEGSQITSKLTTFQVEGNVSGKVRDRSGLTASRTYSSITGGQSIFRQSIRREPNGDHVYTVSKPNFAKAPDTFELLTDSIGRPRFCRLLKGSDSEVDRFAIMMRQPLWPLKVNGNTWTYQIPSLRKGEDPIEVKCSSNTYGKELVITQIVESVILEGGKTYVQSTIHVDKATGALKQVYEWIEHGGKDISNPATVYEEVFNAI